MKMAVGQHRGDREEGSPLIALNVALSHTAKLSRELVFIFVENKKNRAAHLVTEIEDLGLPDNFKWAILPEEFETALRSTLDDLQERGLRRAPTFAFIDPFGITGLPFELIGRLLEQQNCEVLITFMNHTLQRWATQLPDQIDRLIGHEGAAEEIAGAEDRIDAARVLYEQSLQAKAQFVRFFQLKNSNNRPIYDLFFASNSAIGHYKMKEAMWKADETGAFSFSDGVDQAQATLFSSDAPSDFAPTLAEHFAGQTVYWEHVKTYTRDATPFLDKHARRALRLLEAEGGFNGHAIQVDKTKANGKPRIRNSYPAGTRITFLAEDANG